MPDAQSHPNSSNRPHDPSECNCSLEWRRPKLSGICASCGGWVPGQYRDTPWGREGLTLTDVWAGKEPA